MAIYLSNFLLSPIEIEHLDKITNIMNQNNRTRQQFRQCFKMFLERNFPQHRVNNTDLTRLLQQPSQIKNQKITYYYDYVVHELRVDAKASFYDQNAYPALINEIDRLIELRLGNHPDFIALGHGFDDWIDPADIKAPVPEVFINSFLGYRRGSLLTELIRFSFDINNSIHDGFVHFHNEYYRNQENWKVQGNGIFIPPTLYLFGVARNANGFQIRNLGMRFLALKEIRRSGFLSGVLISMDESDTPIAARTILIPQRSHTFDEDHILPNEKLNIDLILQENQYIENELMIEPISHALQNENLKIDNFIDNTTFTTLSAGFNFDIQAETERLCDQISELKDFIIRNNDGNQHQDSRLVIEAVLANAISKYFSAPRY